MNSYFESYFRFKKKCGRRWTNFWEQFLPRYSEKTAQFFDAETIPSYFGHFNMRFLDFHIFNQELLIRFIYIEYFGDLMNVKLNYNYLNLQVHPGRHLDQPVSIQAHQPRYRRPLPHQYPPVGLALWASGVHPVVWGSTSSKRGPGVLWAIMVSSSNPGVWYPPDNPGLFSIWSHVCRIFLSFSAFKKRRNPMQKICKIVRIQKQVFVCAKPLYPWLRKWEYSLSPIIPP